MARKPRRASMAVCVLNGAGLQCEDCGDELHHGDRFIYDPRTEASTCSVICAERMRARDFRPAFAA